MTELASKLDSQDHVHLTLPIMVDTIFGQISFDQKSVFFFPRGIFGFQDLRYMGLSPASENRLAGTLFFQPLPAEQHMFLVIPILHSRQVIQGDHEGPQSLQDDNGAYVQHIKDEHIDLISREARTQDEDKCIVFAMLNLKREENEIVGYANFKSPIVLNMTQRTGYQFILSDDCYEFQDEIFRKPAKIKNDQ